MREIETRVWKILNDARILKTRSHLGVERETKRNKGLHFWKELQ